MDFLPIAAEADQTTICALQQHPNYAAALKHMGANVHGYAIRDAGKTIANLQIVERKIGPVRLRWIPRGPDWIGDTTEQEQARVLGQLPAQFENAAFWIATPDRSDHSEGFRKNGYQKILTPQYVAELDLTLPEEARLRAQRGKWRNRLRHAERSELTVRSRAFKPAKDADLIALETDQRKHRRYSALPAAFLEAWARANPGATRLFIAKRGTKIMAYLLLLLHSPTATYHIGWTGPEGRRRSAHNLLLWHASNWLSSNGFKRFDLGNVDTQNVPGLARFKIGSGAKIRPLGPTYLRIPRPHLRKAPG